MNWIDDLRREAYPAKIDGSLHTFPKFFKAAGGYEEKYREWIVKIDICRICNGGEQDDETGEIGYCGNCDQGLIETEATREDFVEC